MGFFTTLVDTSTIEMVRIIGAYGEKVEPIGLRFYRWSSLGGNKGGGMSC